MHNAIQIIGNLGRDAEQRESRANGTRYLYEKAAQTPPNLAKLRGCFASESPGIFWRNP